MRDLLDLFRVCRGSLRYFGILRFTDIPGEMYLNGRCLRGGAIGYLDRPYQKEPGL